MIGVLGRSPSRYLYPPFLLIDLAFMFSRGGQWRGETLWTVDWAAAALLILGPIAAGLAAAHASFQATIFASVASVAPPRRAIFGLFGAEYLPLALLHLCVVTASVAITLASGGSTDRVLLHGFPQFAILAGYVAAGVLTGTLAAGISRYVGPLVAVALFLVPVLHVAALPAGLTKFGGATGSLAGLQPRWSFDLYQSLFGIGVTLCLGFCVKWRYRLAAPQVRMIVAGAAGVCVIGLSIHFFATTPDQRFETRAQPITCHRDVYEVCLAKDSAYGMPTLTATVHTVLDLERSVNATDIPAGVVQVLPDRPAPAQLDDVHRPISVEADTFAGSVVQRLDVTLPYLLLDERCAQHAYPTPLAIRVLQLQQNYLVATLTGDPSARAEPDVSTLVDLSQQRRDSWLRRSFSDVNRCALTSLTLPKP